MDMTTYTQDEFKAFLRAKAGIVENTKPKQKAEKRYTLYYKNNPIPGFVNKEYKLCVWKKQEMIKTGAALKPYFEIRPTKSSWLNTQKAN